MLTVTNDSVDRSRDSLTNHVYSDLDGQGDCSLPADIAVGGGYSCAFDGDFNGDAFDPDRRGHGCGRTTTNGDAATDDDDATVDLTDVLPPSPSTDASPLALPEPAAPFTFGVPSPTTRSSRSR